MPIILRDVARRTMRRDYGRVLFPNSLVVLKEFQIITEPGIVSVESDGLLFIHNGRAKITCLGVSGCKAIKKVNVFPQCRFTSLRRQFDRSLAIAEGAG